MGSPLPPVTHRWRRSANSKYSRRNDWVSSHPRDLTSAQHQRNSAQHFRALAQLALNDQHIVGGGADRAPSQRLPQRRQQQVAGRPQIAANDDALRIDEVAERRDGGPDGPAGIGDRAS